MKVTVIGSHLCPDTLYALNRLSEVKAEIEFKNLSASLPDLIPTMRPSRKTAASASPPLSWRTAPSRWISGTC